MSLNNPDFNLFVHPDEITPEVMQTMTEQARAAGFEPMNEYGFYLDNLSEEQADTLSAGLRELGIHAQVGATY